MRFWLFGGWSHPPCHGASGTALDGGVRFPDEFSITADAFVLGQVLNFGSLAYVTDCYDELHLLHGAMPAGNEPPASPPPLGPSRADLEPLAYKICYGSVAAGYSGDNPPCLGRALP